MFFSVAVRKAMDAKLCLCVMLIIFGTLSVQGAAPRNGKKISLGAFAGYSDSRSHAPLGAMRTDDDDVAADPAGKCSFHFWSPEFLFNSVCVWDR